MILKSWISPKVEKRISSIHGIGLFAIENILKDTTIAYKSGYLMDAKEFNSLPVECKSAGLQIDKNVFLAPIKVSEAFNVMVGVNHSCSPNVGIRGQIDTTAMRDIKKGEEITGDYATAYQSDYFSFNCNCGHQKCRGIIKANDWQQKRLQKKYSGYMSYYLRDIISNQN